MFGVGRIPLRVRQRLVIRIGGTRGPADRVTIYFKEGIVVGFLRQIWFDERGQDVAEYAVMLAVILVIVVGTIRLIGGNANNVFSQVGSAIHE